MDVVSISPFRASSVLWRPRPDRWTLTVVCKATYALEPGESHLAEEQEPVHERDGFWDDDARLSVYTPSDLGALQAARGRGAGRARLRSPQRGGAIADRAADGRRDGEGRGGLLPPRAQPRGRAPGGAAVEQDAAALRVRGGRALDLEPGGHQVRPRPPIPTVSARCPTSSRRGCARRSGATSSCRPASGRSHPRGGSVATSSGAAPKAGRRRVGRRSPSTTTSTASSSRRRRATSRSTPSATTSASCSST